MRFEVRLLLAFAVILAVVLVLGSGNLSFEEARSKAHQDRSSFSPGQLSRLEKFQARFTEQAFPPCLKSSGDVPGSFAVIVEVGANGHVARSWRQGDSDFVICFQQLMTDNFVFVSMGQPFFTMIEYARAS